MLKYWLLAIRPKTLTIAVVPVLVGSVLGWVESGLLIWHIMLVVLLAAILIQIGTNLHNDVADFKLGADSVSSRLGPPRVTAQGWLSPEQVQKGVVVSFGLAILLGGYLIIVGGWPILAVGIASVVAGLTYTGGPKPIAYTGFGELFVFIFFGLVAVAGSYYLQTYTLNWSALIVGTMIGMPAAAVLVVNNYRDLENDRSVGKHTLAVRIGRRATKVEYGVLMLTPFALLVLIINDAAYDWWLILPMLALPWAIALTARFRKEVPGPGLNQLLAATAQFQFAFGILLCLALLGSHGQFVHA